MQLFKLFPNIQQSISYTELCDKPTPVQQMQKLGNAIGLDNLFIKRDDLSAPFYGGNKVRKLEFLLAEAKKNGAEEVLTFGFAGSNHATATAIHAHRLGMKSISMLGPQPVADIVRNNLLLSYAAGAELHLHPMDKLTEEANRQLEIHKHKTGKMPYLIPAGGSSELGTLGFVNAALELAEQVKNNEIPEPDVIYATLGTSGTIVGLMIGLQIAGLKTKVIPVLVVDYEFMNESRVAHHFNKTVAFLKKHDNSFPDLKIIAEEINIEKDFFGNGYGQFTNAGTEACKLIQNNENIRLEGTYTGKTLAALINHARNGKLQNKTVLFWNTYNSVDFEMAINTIDYHLLPKEFHYFYE